MTRIKCPSEDWDSYCAQQERAEFPNDEERLKLLDAYGHLRWVVGFGGDEDENGWYQGDWLACFDFHVDIDPSGRVSVAYHVVVNSDSGGFIETAESGVVSADKAPLGLVGYWTGIGMETATWTEQEIAAAHECDRRWRSALSAAISQEQS